MASLSREPALAKVLEHEGGYTNHPADPGGPTNFGITIADYRKYVKADARAADVQAMRLDEAKAIYRAAYWDAMRCDELPAGLDYATFDYGVNSGVGRAVRVLQRLLHMADDGRMTDTVIAAVDQRDPAELIAALCDERLAFLKKLKTWPVFGAGWGRRVADVRTIALGMASQAAPPKSARENPILEKTRPPQPDKATPPADTTKRRSIAALAAVVGAVLAQGMHQAGAHLAAAVAVVAAALAIAGWLAWRWRRQRR